MACPELSEVVGCPSYSDYVPVVARLLVDSSRREGQWDEGSSDEDEREVTVFHGYVTEDTPKVDKFLYRLCMYGQASKEVFVRMLVYLNRYQAVTGWGLCYENVHRLMVAAYVTAVKMHDDVHSCNQFFAKLGGVTLKELNKLERTFLLSLDFNLEISSAEYHTTTHFLNKHIPCGVPSPPLTTKLSSFRRKLSSISSSSSAPSSPGAASHIPRGAGLQAVRARVGR
eukprot:TRINITY_DN7009_c0_g1_i1.p1 TRINITY_DN7009_c0_g1~~TRINITY_DN7009_c0_g1_i1.p1  ORF type:complete len:227 (+),score=35.04 TRINITY_DN7009_c0_g1_i1:339-1019(+)